MSEAPADNAVTSEAGSDRRAYYDWFCPWCGTRLSYGIYCKTCEVETLFAWRPTTEVDELIRECRQWPAPEYPRFIADA